MEKANNIFPFFLACLFVDSDMTVLAVDGEHPPQRNFFINSDLAIYGGRGAGGRGETNKLHHHKLLLSTSLCGEAEFSFDQNFRGLRNSLFEKGSLGG